MANAAILMMVYTIISIFVFYIHESLITHLELLNAPVLPPVHTSVYTERMGF